MVVFVGLLIVFGCVIGGWVGFAPKGEIGNLLHPKEYVIILGAALGSGIAMAPWDVLRRVAKGLMTAIKGTPYNRKAYEDLLMVLFELFVQGKKNGVISLEGHIQNPEASEIISKYPSVLQNPEAVTFLSDGLRPLVDGQVKADQLNALLSIELNKKKEEDAEPVSVLTKVGDSLPGFGIVAAVLGIVTTMGLIASSGAAEIGKSVGGALVGTFLGILFAYGVVNPMATCVDFVYKSEQAYFNCIKAALVSFSKGMAPAMAIEVARRGLASAVRPTSQELEELVRNAKGKG